MCKSSNRLGFELWNQPLTNMCKPSNRLGFELWNQPLTGKTAYNIATMGRP